MKNISDFIKLTLLSFLFLVPTSFLLAAELTSTSFKVTDTSFGAGDQMSSVNFSLTGSLSSQSSFGLWSTNSLPLAPGTITSCGKITTTGTYTLGQNLTGISGPCFIILANDVTIDGAGFTVTAEGSSTSYAILATSTTNGGSGFGTTTIQNITFTNFEGGVNASGNDNHTIGDGGVGGNISIQGSNLGTITSLGGNGGNFGNGGKGGVVSVATSLTGAISVNGGDPSLNGGDAGSVSVTNSRAVQDNTPLFAIGGDSVGCGYGGSGGDISLLDSSGYIYFTAAGADATTTFSQGGGCVNPPSGNHGSSGHVSVQGSSNSSNSDNTSPPSPQTSVVVHSFSSLLQTLFLPVNLVSKLSLSNIPSFGGNSKNSFSFLTPIQTFFSSFFTSSSPFDSSPLHTLLLTQGITNEQGMIALSINPKRLLNTQFPGLFTIKGFGTRLAGDTTDVVYQRVTVPPHTSLTISLISIDNKKIVASWDGNTVVFDKNNSITLTAPDKEGIYFLRTPSSPIPLAIVVQKTSQNNISTTTPLITKVSSFLIEIVHKIFSWFGWK